MQAGLTPRRSPTRRLAACTSSSTFSGLRGPPLSIVTSVYLGDRRAVASADGLKAARVAALLVDRGAAVDASNRDGVTPLHQAVRARNLAVVEVLLDRGANPNAADKRGSTPLHRASSNSGASNTAGIDATPFVDLLLGRGADPRRKDKRGRRALRSPS